MHLSGSVTAYITDLIFATKLRSTADSLGIEVNWVRNAEALAERLADTACHTAIIDLDAEGDPLEAIRATRRLENPPRTIAYVSHVRKDLFAAAEDAGADVVMPRSAFSAELPDLLGAVDRD
ncbi:MAG: hypothetical protein O7F76_10935 [Planctomycetota bacterium]|nr:hypothetical protein [Planctomycetota bacterium]